MSSKTPVRATFSGSNVTGLAEYQSGEFIPLTHGGLGASLSIGSAGQVLKVNGAGNAIEFGAVEAIINIDGATDLTGATLQTTDLLMLSDGGTEGRVTLAQLDTLFSGTTATLTNKTLTSPKFNENVALTATSTELNLLDGITAIADEDDMSSNSATSLATQQSIKAYVDSQVTASDLDFQGDSGGALSIDLDSETIMGLCMFHKSEYWFSKDKLMNIHVLNTLYNHVDQNNENILHLNIYQKFFVNYLSHNYIF